MTCHECELLLAMEQPGADESGTDEHLAMCGACRDLAEEMRANAVALRSFAYDDLPGVRLPRPMRWDWALAAAAMLLLMFGLSRVFTTEKLVLPPVQVAKAPPKIELPPVAIPPKRIHKRKPEFLKVKMLTADPNVVIYWLIETKEGTE